MQRIPAPKVDVCRADLRRMLWSDPRSSSETWPPAVGELLSQVSHEMRSPLAVIELALTMLADGMADILTERQLEFVEIARRNAERLERTIDELAVTWPSPPERRHGSDGGR
jgi:signal transduction histidine kinase